MGSFFVYMLRVVNRGRKRFYHDRFFYTGMTGNVARRYQQHLNRIDSGFLRRCAGDSTKELVFVERCESYEGALLRERGVKRLSSLEKERLIAGDGNVLLAVRVDFGVVKAVVLRGADGDECWMVDGLRGF